MTGQDLTGEIEQACRFNCDAESSCSCAAHNLYRAALAEIQRLQQAVFTSERFRSEDAGSHLDDLCFQIDLRKKAEAQLATLRAENARVNKELSGYLQAEEPDGWIDKLRSELATLHREREALIPYLQHKAECASRNDGRRWEPHYKRGRWRPTGWYGAWIPDSTIEYDCTCGLAALLK